MQSLTFIGAIETASRLCGLVLSDDSDETTVDEALQVQERDAKAEATKPEKREHAYYARDPAPE